MFFIVTLLQAQNDKLKDEKQLGFTQFLHLVSQNNLEYAAEKINLQISEAAIQSAKIFPDPSLSFDWVENKSDQVRTGYGYTSELGTTIELGGKRKARINLAKSEKELTQALLDDYFRNLRAEAAILYIQTLKQVQLYEVKQNSYTTMKRLSESDSIRLSLGSIMQTDAVQSKLEAGILLNELLQAEVDMQNSFSQLYLMAGISDAENQFSSLAKINSEVPLFDLNQLVLMAQDNRTDLEAARFNKVVAANATDLTKKERRMDLDFKIAYSNEYFTPDTESAANSISAGVAIPLKFSNLYKGDIKMAKLYEKQSEKLYEHVQLKIKAEIKEAYQFYISAGKQVSNFENSLLNQSEEVLKGKVYSYERGETSLLEVLNAQRTYNDIQAAYIETINTNLTALVELEKVTGIWDLNF